MAPALWTVLRTARLAAPVENCACGAAHQLSGGYRRPLRAYARQMSDSSLLKAEILLLPATPLTSSVKTAPTRSAPLGRCLPRP